MFIHNLKYTVKTLFKNKTLIFWTFAFPIILGLLFNMAFADIEKDEALKVFDIAIVNNESFQDNEIYQETFKELSDDNNDDQLFHIKYVDKKEADDLVNSGDIEGYLELENDKPKLVFKTSGMNQTIMKFVVEEIESRQTMVETLTKHQIEQQLKQGQMFDIQEITTAIANKINNENVTLKDQSRTHLSYMIIEYYTLIAMACMYNGILGTVAMNKSLPNMSSYGKRVSVAPVKKSVVLLSSMLGAYLVSLVGSALLFSFLIFILKVDFGSHVGLVLLLALLGNLAGITLGVVISSCFKVSEDMKTGITIAITMAFSVLSGMMGVTLKYVIDKNIPILNMFNPNNLITDGFYSLYYYDTLTRYYHNVIYLIGFIVVCIVISIIALRRDKYDSI